MNRKTFSVFAMIVLLGCGILIAPQIWYRVPQGEKKIPDSGYATFTIASWDYPDEYGQGIYGYNLEENSSGTFQTYAGTVFWNETSPDFNWTAGVGVHLKVYAILNQTLTGVSSTAEGQNHIRFNVTVATSGSIFATYTMVYIAGSDLGGGLYFYAYGVVFDFLPTSGNIYEVVVTCEIFY